MLKDRAKSANAHTTSDFAAATGRVILHLERMSMIKIAPGHASLPARSLGERRIDRNQTPPKSPRLRLVIIACDRAYPTPARREPTISLPPTTARWKRRVPRGDLYHHHAFEMQNHAASRRCKIAGCMRVRALRSVFQHWRERTGSE